MNDILIPFQAEFRIQVAEIIKREDSGQHGPGRNERVLCAGLACYLLSWNRGIALPRPRY